MAETWRNRIIETRIVTASELAQNSSNFRRHPTAQSSAVRGLLNEVGIVAPLIAYVSERAGGALTLIDGHMRQEIGGEWPVTILNVSDAEADLILASLDYTTSLAELDAAALADLLGRVAMTPVEDEGVAALLAQLAGVAADGILAADAAETDADQEPLPQVEDFPVADLLAPYPYFGGKRAIAGAVWARLGAVNNYVEPFFGSGAVLLSRPNVGGLETVNDFDGFVANFWRAVAMCPDEVATHVDWPVNENDLFARHLWLVKQAAALTERLHSDPDYCDAKIAGWWCWGACNWIGTGWCNGDGPWQSDGETVGQLPHLGDAGRGVNRQLPHLGNAGRGVNRQLPHLGDAGQGVNRQLPHLGDAGQGDQPDQQCAIWSEHLAAMMQKLSDRLRRVRVCCGDWSRVVTSSVTDRHGLTGIFLDPPYAAGAMEYSAGGNQDDTLTEQVRAWCVENGANPQLRIAFCGYEPLVMPGWTALRWTAPKGYQNAENEKNRRREIIWFSPACQQPVLLEAA